MQLGNQICSLELSKRLKELDVKQDSYFYHHWYKKNRDYEYIDHEICAQKIEEFDDGKWKLKVYSAFTTAELGEMLPENHPDWLINYYKENGAQWYCGFSPLAEIYRKYSTNFCEKNEADARAKMLIYLLENKLMELPNE